jgi:tellurite resistance protein
MRNMASYEKRTWWSRHQLTERLAADPFLEAAVTTAFLVAASDGNASEQEYDALLDRLEILGGVDRDKVDDLLTAASNQVEATGFEPLTARVGELVTDKAAAEAALMLGLAVALADDVVTPEERELAAKLAAAVGLAGIDLDAMLAEIRG